MPQISHRAAAPRRSRHLEIRPLSDLYRARHQGCPTSDRQSPEMNQSSSAWSGEALALPGNRHKENDDFRKSATGKTKPGHKQIVSKGSLEVSRLRPRTNHDDNERTSSPKPIQQAPAAHQRQKSGGLGRRVLSKVTSAALRSKSVSRRANENHSDSSSTRLARLGTETGEINTSSRISNYTKDGFDGTETLHDMSYHAKSMKNNIAIYPSRGTVTAPYLEVTTSPDRSVTDKPGNRSLWVTIDVKAVQAGASAGASAGSGHYRLVAFSEPLQPNITNVLVEVIAAEGFEVAEIMGHTRYPLLYTGQSFTVLVRVMRASMTNKRRETSQPSDEDGFEELCSEIETLLSSKCIDAEVLSVKVTYSSPGLPLDTSLLVRHSFRLEHDQIAALSLGTSSSKEEALHMSTAPYYKEDPLLLPINNSRHFQG